MSSLCSSKAQGSHFVQPFAFGEVPVGEAQVNGFPSRESEKAVHVVDPKADIFISRWVVSRRKPCSRYEDHKVSNDFLLKRFPISGKSLSVDSLLCEPALYLCYANSFSKVQNKGKWFSQRRPFGLKASLKIYKKKYI